MLKEEAIQICMNHLTKGKACEYVDLFVCTLAQRLVEPIMDFGMPFGIPDCCLISYRGKQRAFRARSLISFPGKQQAFEARCQGLDHYGQLPHKSFQKTAGL